MNFKSQTDQPFINWKLKFTEKKMEDEYYEIRTELIKRRNYLTGAIISIVNIILLIYSKDLFARTILASEIFILLALLIFISKTKKYMNQLLVLIEFIYLTFYFFFIYFQYAYAKEKSKEQNNDETFRNIKTIYIVGFTSSQILFILFQSINVFMIKVVYVLSSYLCISTLFLNHDIQTEIIFIVIIIGSLAMLYAMDKQLKQQFLQIYNSKQQLNELYNILNCNIQQQVLILQQQQDNDKQLNKEISKGDITQLIKNQLEIQLDQQIKGQNLYPLFANKSFVNTFQINQETSIGQIKTILSQVYIDQMQQPGLKSYGHQTKPIVLQKSQLSVLTNNSNNLLYQCQAMISNSNNNNSSLQKSKTFLNCEFQKRTTIDQRFSTHHKALYNSYPHNSQLYFDVQIYNCNWNNHNALFLLFNDISAQIKDDRVKKLYKYQQEILANMNHNFKTPLNGLSLHLDALMNFIDNKEAKQLLQEIQTNQKLLELQINDYLDYSYLLLNKSQLQLKISTFSLQFLLEDIKQLCQSQTQMKDLRLMQKCTDLNPVKEMIENDYGRLKQVLINLIGNAIKFTYAGSITLSVKKMTNYENLISFEVQDTGIGIQEQSIDKLGQMFEILDEDNIDQRVNGIGLGLTISQMIINQLGPKQKISINSTAGQGTSVYFEIFRKNVQPQNPPAFNFSESNQSLDYSSQEIFQEPVQDLKQNISDLMEKSYKSLQKEHSLSLNHNLKLYPNYTQKINVMIVDDNTFNVQGLKLILQSFKVINNISIAYNGSIAFDQVQEVLQKKDPINYFNLIFMDINMPVMDGLTATTFIKKKITEEEHKVQNYFKIVVVTAFSDYKDESMALKAGADFYEKKPLNYKSVETILKYFKLIT